MFNVRLFLWNSQSCGGGQQQWRTSYAFACAGRAFAVGAAGAVAGTWRLGQRRCTPMMDLMGIPILSSVCGKRMLVAGIAVKCVAEG
jgi:hypothetical protein